MAPSPDTLEALLLRANDLAVESAHVAQTLALHDQALAAVSDGIAILSVDAGGAVITYANSALQALTGYPSEAIVGHDASFLIGDESDPAALRAARDALAGGHLLRALLLQFRREGSGHFWGHLSLSPIRDGSGRVCHFVAVVSDVTERLRTDAALAESGQIFRTVLEATPQAVIAVDAGGIIAYANPRTVDVFGYRSSELLGRSVELLIPERFSGRHPGHFERFTSQPQGRRMGIGRELVARHRDGREFPIEVSLSPVTTSDGLLVFAMCTDLTARREAEAAVQEAEQRARLLLEQAADALLILDRTGRIIDANQQACQALRYERQALIGRPIAEVHVDLGRRGLLPPLDALVPGETVMVEGTYQRGDGSTFPVEVRFGAIEARGGTQVLASARDVTERRRTQRRLERLAHHDQLTGLPNRMRFSQRLEEAISAAHAGADGAVLLLDLDLFKQVNDTLGHQAGDDLLTQVARRLRQTVRSGDSVARLGGDEFGIVLGAVRGIEEARSAAERVLVTIRQPFQIGGRPVTISGSIGIVLLHADAPTSDVVMREVDIAMYRAKRGHLGLAVFDSVVDEAAPRIRRRPSGEQPAGPYDQVDPRALAADRGGGAVTGQDAGRVVQAGASGNGLGHRLG